MIMFGMRYAGVRKTVRISRLPSKSVAFTASPQKFHGCRAGAAAGIRPTVASLVAISLVLLARLLRAFQTRACRFQEYFVQRRVRKGYRTHLDAGAIQNADHLGHRLRPIGNEHRHAVALVSGFLHSLHLGKSSPPCLDAV